MEKSKVPSYFGLPRRHYGRYTQYEC